MHIFLYSDWIRRFTHFSRSETHGVIKSNLKSIYIRRSDNHTYQGHRRWQLSEMLLVAWLTQKWNTLLKGEVDFAYPRRKRKQSSKINVKTWSWLRITFYQLYLKVYITILTIVIRSNLICASFGFIKPSSYSYSDGQNLEVADHITWLCYDHVYKM